VSSAALVAALLAGCATGPTAADEREALIDELIAQTDGALGREEAECVAVTLQEEFGAGSFQEVIDAAADARDDDPVRLRVIDIFDECDAIGPIVEGAPA
jgi:hypothetical protein